MNEIVNKVQQSRLESVDLEKFLENEKIMVLDISQFLFRKLLLREKEFREQLQNHDWSQYDGAWLAVTCSSDALIPHWAWMLVTTYAAPRAAEIVFGDERAARTGLLRRRIETHDWEQYRDKLVLLKGCSKAEVPAGAYLEATRKLMPVASKIMYGEACSNVPVYRKPRTRS